MVVSDQLFHSLHYLSKNCINPSLWLSQIYAAVLTSLLQVPDLHFYLLHSFFSWPDTFKTPVEHVSTPLQYSCLENPMDGGAWWAAVHGVTKSRTRLKWLNSNRTCIRPTKETEPNFLCQYSLVIKNRSFRIRCIWSWILVLSFITCVTMIRLTSSLHFYM